MAEVQYWLSATPVSWLGVTEGTREGCRSNFPDSSLIFFFFFLPRFATLLMLAPAQTQYNSGVSSLKKKKKRAAAISLCSKEEDLKAKSTSSITGKHKGCTRDPSWSWGGFRYSAHPSAFYLLNFTASLSGSSVVMEAALCLTFLPGNWNKWVRMIWHWGAD